MHLTDNRANSTKWQFPPATTLPADGFLVVFASGHNLLDPQLDENRALHTNFQLDSDGEYLALTSEDGSTIFEIAEGFPPLRTDISFGLSPDNDSQRGYFLDPTPGAANSNLLTGVVSDTKFSVDRGFFETPFELEITTETPNAVVRYTTDGSQPTESHGASYEGPLTIEHTTTLRAAAFRSDLVPTNTDTHTYFFLDDVLDQGRRPPEGFPSTWGRTFTDWGMDQDSDDLARIAGDQDYSRAEARQVIKDSLTSLPTMSLVTTIDGMFGTNNGIYSNTQGRGERWERPVSVEYVDPSGMRDGFQVDGGIRIQGFTSRDPNRNPKHSLRLVFRDEYGSPELEYPLFGPNAASSFDTIVLRSNSQDAWVYDSRDNRQGQFIRDEWARQTQLEMGQVAAHGTWVHLYINGLYWGLYNPTERPDATFNASYVGGNEDDYDVIKNHEEVIDGDIDAYRDLLAAIQKRSSRFQPRLPRPF